MGKSIWSSSASGSRNSSSTWCTTSAIRASARSTLLMTSTTGSRASSVLRRTKRVWGSGPSDASTRSRTPSTMVSPRSTSPPKSACPGVSTMFSLTPPQRTAVFLARMVMPFSRSRSPESMTRSVSSWWAPKAPVWRKSASTRVVLPWSTCATMATFLMSSRASVGAPTIDDLGGLSFSAPSGGRSERRGGTAQRQLHRLRAESERGRLRLDTDQVARIGPPPDDAARHVVPAPAQRLDQGHEGELGAHRGTARPREHDQMPVLGAHVGPPPEGEQCGMGAVPPVVTADDWCRREGRPVEGAPQPGGPRHGLRTHGSAPGRREAVHPAVQLRGGGTALAYPARRLVQPAPHGLQRGAGLRTDQQADGGHAERSPRRERGPGERIVVAGIGGIGVERAAHLVIGHAEAGCAGAPDGEAGQLRLRLFESAPPGARVHGGAGLEQRVHEPVIHARRCEESWARWWPARAMPRCARRSPAGVPRARPPRRSGRRRTPAAPAGREGCRSAAFRAGRGNAVSAAPPPTVRRPTIPRRTATPCPVGAVRPRGRTSRGG